MIGELNILHVEDSADDAELVERALSAFKAEFRRVETEGNYVAELLRHAPDVILCDYDLPRFSAERALQILRKRGLVIPFIVVSNHIGQSDAVIAMQQGASDYLSKSDLGRLGKAVEAAVDRARALREKGVAEEALRRSEATLRGILDSLLQRLALLDERGTILAVNKAWEGPDEHRRGAGTDMPPPGTNYMSWLQSAARSGNAVAARLLVGISAVMARQAPRFDLEYELVLGETHRWHVTRAFPLEGSDRGVVVSHGDITDQMMSRITIENGNRRLQELSKRILSIQEEERRALSMELHDDIGQSLAALKIGLHRMARNPLADHAALLGECLSVAESTLDKLRDVAHELRPPQLDQLGLADALAWLAERQRKATGLAIDCRFSGLEQRRPASALESACYRIAQESMSNAARHAKASSIRIHVDSDGKLLRLTIHDDGVGFDAEAARLGALKSGSLGLIGMEERARLAGGRLNVQSIRGSGTTVSAVFPFDSRAEFEPEEGHAAAA